MTALQSAAARLEAGDRYGAREIATRALADARADGDDELQLQLLNLLGITAKHTGEWDLAASSYADAIGVLERTGGNPEMLGALHHNLGGLAFSRGDLAAAERETRLALEVHGELHGPQHRSVLAHLGQLGSILSQLGRLAEASDALERAADGFAAALGPDHLEVGIATTSLGLVRHRQGRLAEAGDLYRRGLEIREAAVGPDHPELAFTLLNLCALATQTGDPGAGRAHASRALGLLEGRVSEDHPALVRARRLSSLERSLPRPRQTSDSGSPTA